MDSATPTDMPETNQRSSAPELEADPNNASWVNGNDRGAPGDLECERTPSAVVAEAGARVPGGGAGDGGQPWPGPDFKLQQVLEGSVYLWACGEQGNEGGAKVTPCVCRCESAAAWVVLLVSIDHERTTVRIGLVCEPLKIQVRCVVAMYKLL